MGSMTNGLMSLGSAGLSMFGSAQASEEASDQAKMQADLLRQQAEYERVQAENNAAMMRRQREMEKAQERRNYEQELARARVGGVSAESLLASADRFSLGSSQKDWLTGQQSQGILDAASRRSTSLRAQASAYGAKAKGSKSAGMFSLLQGGLQGMGSILGGTGGQVPDGGGEPASTMPPGVMDL